MIFVSGYKVAGTVSGRLSSTKLFDHFGNNAQNQADENRRIIIPRPGYRFAQNDYEGAEAVIVALLVHSGNFRDLIKLKIKPHNFLCLKLFPEKFSAFISPSAIESMTPADLKAHPFYKQIVKLCKQLKREYDLAKRTIHGANYGEGWKTLQQTILTGTQGQVVLSAKECKHLLTVFFDLFPEIKLMQAMMHKAVEMFIPVRNLFGQEFNFIARYSSELGRRAISTPPQSTVGMLMNIAMTRLQNHIESNNKRWNILNIVHDSGLSEAPSQEVHELADVKAKCMHHVFTSPIDNWEYAIGVEKSVGDNWGKYDEHENPNGLKVVEN